MIFIHGRSREDKEICPDGSSSSAGMPERKTNRFTTGMTPVGAKAVCFCAIICALAVICCFIVTLNILYTLCLFAFLLILSSVLYLICRLNAKKTTYRSKTWAVYFILLAGAAVYIFSMYNYEYNADPFNLLFAAETISTYDDALNAAEKNHTNTVIEISESDLTSTNFGYAVQSYQGGALLESKDLYSFYIFRMNDKFVLCKADPEYLNRYFDQKKENGDVLTRIFISKFDRADAGVYDSIYSPVTLLYPNVISAGEIEIKDDEGSDNFIWDHKVYEKYYSDLPLYELSGDFVMTVKEYDLNKQKTILVGLTASFLFLLSSVVAVIACPLNKKR